MTSHSPYVIEGFEPEQTLILRRDNEGRVVGRAVSLAADVKAKTYRRHLRRGFAEAILAKGVIVAEGFTEVVALQAVASAMEAADAKNYPLDLSGITIVTPDGDGAIAEFGRFFVSLDLPTFAFLDRKARNKKDEAALNNAGFSNLYETAYAGMEELLVTELPVNHQWTFLESIRDAGTAPSAGIPSTPPDEEKIRYITQLVLKDSKGWGRAADLIALCKPDELPSSITSFLSTIYDAFPRPPIVPLSGVSEGEEVSENASTSPEDFST